MSLTNKINAQAKGIFKGAKKVMQYLRINDSNNLVSLTNIAMMLILVKIAMTPVTTFEDLTALTVAVLGYQGKRLIEAFKK